MALEDWVDPAALAGELDTVRAEFAAADAAIELLAGGGGYTEKLACTINTGQDANTTGTLTLTQTDQTGTGFTVTGTDITVNFTGWVTLSFGINLAGGGQRSTPRITATRAGIALPALTAGHTYIRNAGGHDSSTANAANVGLPVTMGDVIRLSTVAAAAAGSVTVQAGSGLSVRRV